MPHVKEQKWIPWTTSQLRRSTFWKTLWNDKPQSWRKWLWTTYLIKELYPKYIFKSLKNSVITNQKLNLKDLKRPFTKEDTQMANKHAKRCSTLWISGKYKLKIQWDLITHPLECLDFIKTDHSSFWQGRGTNILGWQTGRKVRSFWERAWQILEKLHI